MAGTPNRAGVVEAFLARYFADEDAGTVRELADYQRAFPGHDDTILQAWRRMHARASGSPTEIGSFRLLHELGRGGQGIVHLAEDTRLGRRVALKVLSGLWTERMLERFRREGRLASRLDHPNVCPVFDAGVDDGTPWIAMAFVPGGTLADRIGAGGPLPGGEATSLGADLARALHAAHQAGVVHRDVKPANVRITPEGRPVLTDFGVAREVEALDATLTATGEFVGTLQYTAPEILEGRPADARSDVYGLGITLFEALSGKVPFDAPTQGALVRAILDTTAPDVRSTAPRVGADLATVVATALARDPRDRYATAEALAADLENAAAHRPIAARPAGSWLRLLRWGQREPRAAVAVLSAFATLAAGLVVALALLADVTDEREAKDRALSEIAMLADRTRLEELRGAIVELEPPWPSRIDAIRPWLGRADELVARRDRQGAILEALHAAGRPATPEELRDARARHPDGAVLRTLSMNLEFVESRIAEAVDPEEKLEYLRDEREQLVARIAELEARIDGIHPVRFDDPAARWRHGLQLELVAELDAFLAADEHGATRARVERLLTDAERLREAMDGPLGEPWSACCVAIADVDRHPIYRGLRITPLPGLAPLGADPATGLFEFADMLTGTIPEREPGNGALQIDDTSAIVFVLLPGGTARIGAFRPGEGPDGESQIDALVEDHERPAHDVALDPFLLGKFEVTQAQWVRITGTNPSQNKPGTQYRSHPVTTPLHPVESISWFDAANALRRLGCELPTSAQWEYALRAGSTTPFPTGATPRSLAGSGNLADLALRRVTGRPPDEDSQLLGDDAWGGTAPVGSFPPNPFGLHDMTGNVQEWCRDLEHDYDVPARPGDGLRTAGSLGGRTLRGGSYMLSWVYGRSAAHHSLRPQSRQYDHGVRVSRALR